MRTTLVWFKTDLRLLDNDTLVKAVERSDRVIPVYCLDREQFGFTAYGFRKSGRFRARFLLETLQDLDRQLRLLGSGLLLVEGPPEAELPKLAVRYNASRLFTKKEVGHEELEQHARVEQALWKVNCAAEVFSTSTLYLATDLPFSIKDIPDQFTSFKNKIEHEGVPVRSSVGPPLAFHSPDLPPLRLPSLSELGFEETQRDPRSTFPFEGGETQAIQRLNYYLFGSRLVSRYKDTRNQLLGTDYSSKFSPWMALGSLSPRYIYHQLKHYENKFGANASTYWLVFELMWRDYFRFMMKKYHAAYFKTFGIKKTGSKKTHNEKHLLSWINGTTGADLVDAAMTELRTTGFLSNRARQNAASFLCHELDVDWRYGAAYFEEQLIDYDVCSNWGNWAYIAGVGNNPRGKSKFNIDKQAAEYDRDGRYRSTWLEKTS